MDFLDFEKPIIELEKQIDELRLTVSDEHASVEIDDEIQRLEIKCAELTKKISNPNYYFLLVLSHIILIFTPTELIVKFKYILFL